MAEAGQPKFSIKYILYSVLVIFIYLIGVWTSQIWLGWKILLLVILAVLSYIGMAMYDRYYQCNPVLFA